MKRNTTLIKLVNYTCVYLWCHVNMAALKRFYSTYTVLVPQIPTENGGNIYIIFVGIGRYINFSPSKYVKWLLKGCTNDVIWIWIKTLLRFCLIFCFCVYEVTWTCEMLVAFHVFLSSWVNHHDFVFHYKQLSTHTQTHNPPQPCQSNKGGVEAGSLWGFQLIPSKPINCGWCVCVCTVVKAWKNSPHPSFSSINPPLYQDPPRTPRCDTDKHTI